jgi:DNA-binding LytR/AlgR family response regulator
MKVLITENDQLYAGALEVLLKDMGHQVVAIADNAQQALRLIKATQPDLLLSGIHLKGENDGVYVAEKLREQQQNTPVIFVTSSQDTQVFERAKHTNPFAYITKPVDKTNLLRTVELAFYRHTQHPHENKLNTASSSEHFFVKVGRQLRRIHIPSIYYIEVDRKYSTIALEHDQLKTRMPLQQLALKLPNCLFLKVHKSYMVNLQKIDEVDMDGEMIKVGRHQIPLSRRHKKELIQKLT